MFSFKFTKIKNNDHNIAKMDYQNNWKSTKLNFNMDK